MKFLTPHIQFEWLYKNVRNNTSNYYTPRNEVRGGVYWNHPVRLSVRLSVDTRLGKMVSSA